MQASVMNALFLMYAALLGRIVLVFKQIKKNEKVKICRYVIACYSRHICHGV